MPITPFLNNASGLNIADSPLTIKDTQATGQSYNYNYSRIGAISKILAPSAINSLADSQLKTLGIHYYHSSDTSDIRTPIRCAGTKIQSLNIDTGALTNITDDTNAAGTNFLNSSSTQPVVSTGFISPANGVQLWMAGGGLSNIVGYNGTNVTSNGTKSPTGSISTSVNTHNSGNWVAAGKYYWAVVFRKRSSQATSNAALDVTATTVNTDDTVTIDFTSISNLDTTLYDQIWLYRSAISGSSAFTTGNLVAQLASTTTSYIDTGSSIASAVVVPRAGGTTDNSVLPTNTYNTVCSFKRRLVTAAGSTIYLSDTNKSESWPISNTITVPSGGSILAVCPIGVNSEVTTGADEYLLIFKEKELWILTGTSSSDWQLVFNSKVGAIGQASIVQMTGFVAWLAQNGIFVFDGSGKPIRISRPINALWESDGDLDKPKLNYAWGAYFEKTNEVIWRVSHRTKGEQKLSIKMDMRLTVPVVSQNVENREADGVFILDTDSNSFYAGCSFRPSSYDEKLLTGDGSGFVYNNFISNSSVSFDYESRPLDMGAPQKNKRFSRVLVWVERLTTDDLTLYYWSDYKQRPEYQSKMSAPMSPLKGTAPALWDIGFWDISYWDDYQPDIGVIEFNLQATENNVEGSALRLRFEQLTAAPVRIHGFAVEWEDLGGISIPVPMDS